MKFTKTPIMLKLIWGVSFSVGSYEGKRLERKAKNMSPKFQKIKEELRNITTVNLISNTSSILEKIFWALIAILGTLFILVPSRCESVHGSFLSSSLPFKSVKTRLNHSCSELDILRCDKSLGAWLDSLPLKKSLRTA